jgi:hypothetical protein
VNINGRAVGPATVIPDSGLVHRYDATEISANDGDSISTWTDKEGTDDLTQATSSNQPTLKTNILNGKQIVRFDGSSQYLDVPFGNTVTQGHHTFVVGQKRSGGTNDVETLIDAATDRTHHLFGQNDNNNNVWAAYGGSEIQDGAEDSDPHIWTVNWDGSSSAMRLDGSQDASGDLGSEDMDGLTVGRRAGDGQYGDYDVGEIIIYATTLSDSDRDNVESFLANKWGIALS